MKSVFKNSIGSLNLLRLVGVLSAGPNHRILWRKKSDSRDADMVCNHNSILLDF